MKNRKPNRLRNYDYSQNGMYFITICAKDRFKYFGEIENGKMMLNELGKIAEKCYLEIPNHFLGVFLDEFMIMPNHIHVIIEINNNDEIVGTDLASVRNKNGQTQGLSLRDIGLLSRVIQAFKSKTAVEYLKLMKLKNMPYIPKIWQRSFHDHIIRNEKSLNKIREYIQTNPQMWERDRNNAENIWM